MAKKMKLKFKPAFPWLAPVIWQPNPKNITKEGKDMVGKLMFFMGEIPDQSGHSSGHCVALYDEKVLQMLHTVDFRLAKDNEF
jgi:hypothetical protein